MSWLSALIALFTTRDDVTGTLWNDAYFDRLVVVETWFFHASWWIWGIGIVVGIIIALLIGYTLSSGSGRVVSCQVGCLGIVFLLLPLLEYITMRLAMSMASAYGPEGVINQGKLIISAALYLFLGVG